MKKCAFAHASLADLSVIGDVKAKLSRFPRRENVTLHKAVVYDGTLSPQVEKRRCFDALIPARLLWF